MQVKKENKGKDVCYISHGGDGFPNMFAICQENDVEFIRPDYTVELLLLGRSYAPEIVYGFNSSALFSIKKMMPDTIVKNFLLNRPSKIVKDLIGIADYYQMYGIEKIEFV